MSSWVLSQKCSSSWSIWKHSLRGLLGLVPIWQLLITLSFCKSSTPSPKLTRVRDNEPLCSASPYNIDRVLPFLFMSIVLQIAVLIVTTKSASVNQKLLYCDSMFYPLNWSTDGKFTNAPMHLHDSRPWSSQCAEKPTSQHFVHQSIFYNSNYKPRFQYVYFCRTAG